MNLRTINVIIRREYLNRVKKKSFLLITFLSPILFAALCIIPSVIMIAAKEDAKKVAVVDNSGIVMPYLTDNETVSYFDCSSMPLDSVKSALSSIGYDAVLGISEIDPENKVFTADVFSSKPLGMDMTENMNRRINDALEAYRISSYNISGLDEILRDVKANVKLKSYTLGEDGKETISESGVYMAVSMILGMVIYLFIVMFGAMVMSSVIEEKASRVVEVLVSSVKATELMFGKIIGIALVAITQFLLWIVLTVSIVGVAGGIMGKDILSSFQADDTTQIAAAAGLSQDQMDALAEMTVPSVQAPEGGLEVVMSTLQNIDLGQVVVCFFIFFIFGYMLYASLYAAIGSAVENEGDSQQLQMPVTIPLLLGFFIALYAFKAPQSAITFWGSMIPFTSPIVMLARLPFGVPTWEIVLSISLLVVTFLLCAWASAKIYRVGILMFGKKSTWKDLWKWLRQS